MNTDFLIKCYPNLEKGLISEIEKHAAIKDFPVGETIVNQGQYVRNLPIVLSGHVKVFSVEEDIQFLLYYISSGGACMYSFAHIIRDEPADFTAVAESDCSLLLLPIRRVHLWLSKYPTFGNIVFQEYQKHYQDLLNTTKQIICYNLEDRLIDYLKKKVKLEKSNLLSISHQNIADDLGTSREVITRIMKKLGLDQKIKQEGRKIKVL